MLNDLRHGLRTLLREKGWTAVVLLSLALGIGANTALFSSVNSLYLRKLAVADPDALVRLKWIGKNEMETDSSEYGFSRRPTPDTTVRATFSYPIYRQFVADNDTMVDLFACAPYRRANLVVDGHADIAAAFAATGNYYRVLGLSANPGRIIVPDDDRPTAAPVAVISAQYWKSRFGGDPNVIGKVVRLNNVALTIVGVISPDLIDVQHAVGQGPDIAVPLALVSQFVNASPAPGEPDVPLLERPTYWWLQIMGRVKPGVTPAQVQANLGAVFQHAARAGLDTYLASLAPGVRSDSRYRDRAAVPRLIVEPGSKGIYDVNPNDSRSILILSVVVALMLLIVCANVANLLLARASTRYKEISIRLSMGATRGRLVRQLLTESVLLATIGGAFGILVARWGRQFLPGPASQIAPLDGRVLSFVAAASMLTGILFGIAPALRSTAMNVSAALKETSRSVIGSRSVLGRVLLVAQVAISLVLLIAAGLFLRTLQNLRNVDVGFNTRNLVVFRVSPALNQYDQQRSQALFQQIADRLRGLAGVRGVAISHVGLLSGFTSSTSIVVQGRRNARHDRDTIYYLMVSADFFGMMEMPIVRGRGFTAHDDEPAPKVAVINETAARVYFPNEDPIGRRFGSRPETAGEYEIVGIVRDAKYDSVRDPAPPTMFVPYLQRPMTTAVFDVRTAVAPAGMVPAIRDAVRRIDPNLPLMNVSTQVDEMDQRLEPERIFAQAYTVFGSLALLLAAIGLFGLMSYSVSRRTNEIGVRMALGARRVDVLALVMRESIGMVAVGVAAGLAMATAAGRLVATLLFGVAPTDSPTMIGAAAALVLVACMAAYVPARRAANVDPLEALRYE